jgi:HPP family.
LHPPGGATAFFAASGGTKIVPIGFALYPALAGAAMLLPAALATHALAPGRRSPEY